MRSRSATRCLLLDSSPADRVWLRRKLALCEGVSVVGEAATLPEARHLIATVPHDLVFSDTRLGNGDAMPLADELRPGVRIAFISQHRAEALRAFEFNALDFLSKPAGPERLAVTLARLPDHAARGRLSLRSTDSFRANSRRLSPHQKICIRSGAMARLASPGQIISITAQDNYSEVTLVDGDRVFVRQTMRAWNDVLPPRDFFRVHRTRIVNLAHVVAWRREEGPRFFVSLRNLAQPVGVSRQRWLALAPKIGAR